MPNDQSEISEGDLLWTPATSRQTGSNLFAFTNWLKHKYGLSFASYDELWEWSITERNAFWASIWDYFQVESERKYDTVSSGNSMFSTRWFEGARLNFTQHLLRHESQSPDRIVFHGYSEKRPENSMTWSQVGRAVRAVATKLREIGIRPGDRIVSYMPNVPETAIAMMAATAVGAVWAAAAPEFGVKTVLDRFGQLEPVLLFAADGYSFSGKDYDRVTQIDDIVASIPSIKNVVLLPLIDATSSERFKPKHFLWDDLVATTAPGIDKFKFEQVVDNHPLWVLFSSGTSGLPKAIVHGHAGMLLEHLKAQHFHMEMNQNSILFFYCTTSWMVWNSTLAALLAGASIVMYDGNPLFPGPNTIWDIVEKSGTTALGASPSLVARMEKDKIAPKNTHNIETLETIVLGGAPSTPETYAWFYRNVKEDICVASQSGGTEICSGFVGAVSTLPVYAGEMQARMLGFNLQSWSDDGDELVDKVGELVICSPFPSMPISFWNDPDRARYHETYFEHFPGIWRQGDLFKINGRGGCFIYGRSDSTLNRHGVRIGTAEIYRTLDNIPQLIDGLALCLHEGTPEACMTLFLHLAPGVGLDELEESIRTSLRTENSPRHIPDNIIEVPAIPYTLTGKRMEVPVRKILEGHDASTVIQPDMMLNSESIDWYLEHARKISSIVERR